MQPRRFFYGWINLAVLFVNYFAIMGSITYAYGIVVGPMSQSIGLSLAVMSGGYTGYMLVSALVSPLVGSFIKRHGAKKSILLGLLITASGAAALGLAVKGPTMYYIAYSLLIGLGTRLCTVNPSQVSLTKWFFAKRGLAFAVLLSSGGIGGYVFTPLFSKISANYSWEMIWLLIAALCAVSFILVLLFLKETPSDVGQQIDNGKTYHKVVIISRVHKTRDPWTLSQALLTKEFYCIIWLFFGGSIVLSSVSAYAVIYLSDAGHTAAVAAQALALFALFSTVGRFIMGLVTDTVEAKYLVIAGSGLILAGLLLMQTVSTPAMLYLSVIVAGLGGGALLVTPNTMLANYYGTHDYARISSVFAMASGIFSAPISTVFALIMEHTGSYTGSWMMIIGANALCLLIGFFIRPPKFKTTKREVTA